jgi:predicted outer membrane protein
VGAYLFNRTASPAHVARSLRHHSHWAVSILPFGDPLKLMNVFHSFPSRTSLALAGAFLLGATVMADAAPRVRHVSARNVMQRFAAEPLAANEFRPAERAFLIKAVESAREQMRLAKIAVSQSTNTGVRSHAQQLVGDYRSLSDSLEGLIRRRGGIPGAPVGGSSENFQKLVALPAGEFDRQFVRMVGRTTDDILTAFEQVVSDSTDEDVRELAAAQLPVLRAHRSEVTQLQKTLN